MHTSLPGSGSDWTPGLGHYRALVDLMGHRELGGKTLLYLIDGLFGGYYWDSHPYKWKSPPFGDGVNGDWPSSLFASLDPVAIDSVAYDFLLQEWPKVVTGGSWSAGSLQGGAEDYLHEAALANQPPSGAFYDPEQSGAGLSSLGVHEHWNNPVDKQYSRNLGGQDGIELVALTVTRSAPQLSSERSGNHTLVSWPSALTGYQLQAAANLQSPVNWQAVTTAPVFMRGRNVVSNELLGPSGYFRLVK
jgi:hypothetical protein